MFQRNLRAVCFLFAALVTNSLVACSDDDDDDVPDGSAGSAGRGGSGGTSGSGGDAGGDNRAGEGGLAGDGGIPNQSCTSHERCAEWGGNAACPATIDDATVACSFGGFEVRLYNSSCGGQVVTAANGIQYVRWTFDAAGTLIGALALGDSGDCDQWGSHCEPMGEPDELCGAAGAGGAGGAGGDSP